MKLWLSILRKMKKKVTYLFNKNGTPVSLIWIYFEPFHNKYGNLLRFMDDEKDKAYIKGFSTNDKTLETLPVDTWKQIEKDIKEFLLRYNIEEYGLRNTSQHIKMSPPWQVYDSKKPNKILK